MNYKSFFLLPIIFIILGFFYIIENNLAIFFLGSLFYISLLGFIQFLRLNKTTFYIFNIFSLFYILHLVFVHYGFFYMNNTYLLVPDETFFYKTSNGIISYLEKGYGIFDINKIYTFHEMPAYIYLSGKIAILANHFGENSILIQKLFVIFTAASIPAILYLILIKYLDLKAAFYSSLLFGFFTHLTFLSSLLLRDIFVAFTYIVFFFVLLDKINLKNILIILITCFFSIYLRLETGLFLISLSFIYFIYSINKIIRNAFVRRIFVFLLLISVLVILYFLDIYQIFLKIYESSSEHAIQISTSGSLALKLKSLPYGIGYIAMSIFSQLQPFPIWLDMDKFSIISIFSAIGGFTWFFIVSYSIYGVLKIKILKNIDIKLVYLFYSSIIYIVLLSSSEGVVRRLIVVYPIIFIISAISYDKMTLFQRKKVFLYCLSIYIFLHIVYFLLKL